MTLSSQLSTDPSIFFNTDEFAQSVIYTAAAVWDGTVYPANAITGIVSYGENLDAAGSRESAMAQGALWVKVSDVANPVYRDVVVIGSDIWRVRRIAHGDGHVWKLEIYRDQRPVLGS